MRPTASLPIWRWKMHLKSLLCPRAGFCAVRSTGCKGGMRILRRIHAANHNVGSTFPLATWPALTRGPVQLKDSWSLPWRNYLGSNLALHTRRRTCYILNWMSIPTRCSETSSVFSVFRFNRVTRTDFKWTVLDEHAQTSLAFWPIYWLPENMADVISVCQRQLKSELMLRGPVSPHGFSLHNLAWPAQCKTVRVNLKTTFLECDLGDRGLSDSLRMSTVASP